jgi:hypothetical protein
MKERGDEAAALVAAGQGSPGDCMATWLIMNMQGGGERPEALLCLEKAAGKLREEYVRYDLIADALVGKSSLPAAEIVQLPMRPDLKAIVLTVLGARDAANRALYFDLARKLNYRVANPHYLLKKILDTSTAG